MNAAAITWRLAQLSSLPFQERYVIGGSQDEYVLDVELLENVDSLKFMIRRRENCGLLTDKQTDALEDLFAYVETHSGEALSAKSRDEGVRRLRESTVWKTLRSKATTALEAFGLPADMSVEEIDRLSE